MGPELHGELVAEMKRAPTTCPTLNSHQQHHPFFKKGASEYSASDHWHHWLEADIWDLREWDRAWWLGVGRGYDWMGTVSLEQEMGEVWGLRLTIQRAPKGPSQGPSPSKKVSRVMSLPPSNTLQLPCLTQGKSQVLSVVCKAPVTSLTSSTIYTQTQPSWLSLEKQALLPQGLCTDCSLCLECSSLTSLHVAPFLTSFKSFLS